MMEINQVAILGANFLAIRIAAQMANAGVPVLLFDQKQSRAEKYCHRLFSMKPEPLFVKENARFITPCNYAQDVELLADADWIIDTTGNDPAEKKSLFQLIQNDVHEDAIISLASARTPLTFIAEYLPKTLLGNFLVTHFPQPYRNRKLIELLSLPETTADTLATITAFCEDRLGKNIIYVKDTPNFIADRIGAFCIMSALHYAQKFGLSVEAVDRLTGPVIGWPKSATFRVVDMMGLDELVAMAKCHLTKNANPAEETAFQASGFLEKMIKEGRRGQLSGKGFYKSGDNGLQALDLEKATYRPLQKNQFDALRLARREHTLSGKIHALVNTDDVAGQFIWQLLADVLVYAANQIPEIADDIVQIDNAAKWGLGWELGPFEIWDALGFRQTTLRMKAEGRKMPLWIEAVFMMGGESFYDTSDAEKAFLDIDSGKMQLLAETPDERTLHWHKINRNILLQNWNASLIDLDDGILCVEFHSIADKKRNPVDLLMLDMLDEAFQIMEKGKHWGMMLATDAANFASEIYLPIILELIEKQQWAALESLSKRCQGITQKLYYSSFPMVAAPFGKVNGLGLELIMAANKRIADSELHCRMSQVEKGLLPFGGGLLMLLKNFIQEMAPQQRGPFPPVKKAFEAIFFAKRSRSALAAAQDGWLKPSDSIQMQRRQLLAKTRKTLIRIAENYVPPEPMPPFYLPGEGGRIALEIYLANLRKKGEIGVERESIGKKLAYILTGGNRATLANPVMEADILELETAAFLELCKTETCQSQLRHFQKTGKAKINI